MEISKFLKDENTAYELKPITLENINKYDELVAKNNAYGYEGRLIHSHISTHPTNTDKDEVAMKIILIDFTNNTNINRQKKQNALDEISNAIINTPNFDEMLKNGDAKAVEIIASASEKNNFSFASKYCTYHSHTLGGDKYYIYDSLVQELLPFYAKIYGIKITESTIKGWKNSKNYTAFRNLMDEILRLNGLSDEVNIRRKFDHFLWWQGKEINEEIVKSKKLNYKFKGEAMANITTFTDLPAKSDLFGLNPYIDGLANFINGCATPITIAIQGDWGSGKTSMMEMTKEKLGKGVYPVWFNTWQYSQFNLDTELTVSFMREIVDSIGAKMEIKKGFDKALNSIGIVAKNVATLAADRFMGEQAGKVVGEVIDSFSDSAIKATSAAAAVKILRSEFEKCVTSALKDHKKDKLVIFVDDLDRLNPQEP